MCIVDYSNISVIDICILQDEVNEIRDNMAVFQSHIQSYDSQLEELKRQAGDTTHDVTKYKVQVKLLYRNVSGLKDSLETVQSGHKDTTDNLDLLTAVSWGKCSNHSMLLIPSL